MHFSPFTTSPKQWEEGFDFYIYSKNIWLKSMNCLYSGDKAIMKGTNYFNTKKKKKLKIKKNNPNELKSKQYGWLEDDDPICF